MNRVLVTGASGFVGRHCLPLLRARGFEVYAVGREALGGEDLGATWHRADLLDAAQCEALLEIVRPTHLLHLAWYAVPGKYGSAPENFTWVRASLALIEAFRKRGGQRVVVAGTCAEYDWRHGLCSEEVTPLAPRTFYGACKHHLEGLLSAYGRAADLSSAWGRLFFLYGPHEDPARLVASTARALLRGEPALCTHGNQVRDFLHVEDAADAFAALLDGETTGPVNIASGAPVAVKDIVQGIADRLGRHDLVQLGAKQAPPDDPPFLVADVTRLTRDVGWMPGYDLSRGLDETVEYWKRELG